MINYKLYIKKKYTCLKLKLSPGLLFINYYLLFIYYYLLFIYYYLLFIYYYLLYISIYNYNYTKENI